MLVPFPFTDLSGQKVRPAVVLFSSKYGEDCIVVFISSARPKKISIHEVLVKPSAKNGLKVESVIKMEKIATLQKKIILGELGILELAYLSEVNRKLKKLFNI